MTKIIIDVNELKAWVEQVKKAFTDDGEPLNIHYIYSDDLINKINELSTPQQQESCEKDNLPKTIKLDIGWFRLSEGSVHKMLRKETSYQLKVPDSVATMYRITEGLDFDDKEFKVFESYVEFNYNGLDYVYSLDENLSDDKNIILSQEKPISQKDKL